MKEKKWRRKRERWWVVGEFERKRVMEGKKR